MYLWQQKTNKPKPSIIVIMIARKKGAHPDHLLYLWQHTKKKSIEFFFIVNVINDYDNYSRVVAGRKQENKIYCEGACDRNTNKSHHLICLWEQEKNKSKPSTIVIMIARKEGAHPYHLLYLWQQKNKELLNSFLLSM